MQSITHGEYRSPIELTLQVREFGNKSHRHGIEGLHLNRTHATGSRLFLAAVLAGGMVTTFGGSAQAAVSSCSAHINVPIVNRASAQCLRGFGKFRVKAQCDSPNYPYTTTVYGPWRTLTSGGGTSPSVVNGDSYNCHVTKAWVDAR
ncbi:hypothetical protein P9869_11615 [Streptomyces ossamyceticus]|nr:hypothetical protein [Streptomyces ossamyceticus]